MSASFLLDTNVPSEMMKKAGDPAVKGWVKDHLKEPLYFSVMSVGEVRKGIELMDMGRRRAFLEQWLAEELIPAFGNKILPVTLTIGESWGRLDAMRRRLGRPIGVADGLIAATALVHGLTLVTRNVKDFAGLGLKIADPWER